MYIKMIFFEKISGSSKAAIFTEIPALWYLDLEPNIE